MGNQLQAIYLINLLMKGLDTSYDGSGITYERTGIEGISLRKVAGLLVIGLNTFAKHNKTEGPSPCFI
jgi:hypothetical protein